MSAIQNRMQNQSIDRYISELRALGNDVEQKRTEASNATGTDIPIAQAALESSQLKFQNAATTVKKMLDFMKELLQMFSR